MSVNYPTRTAANKTCTLVNRVGAQGFHFRASIQHRNTCTHKNKYCTSTTNQTANTHTHHKQEHVLMGIYMYKRWGGGYVRRARSFFTRSSYYRAWFDERRHSSKNSKIPGQLRAATHKQRWCGGIPHSARCLGCLTKPDKCKPPTSLVIST